MRRVTAAFAIAVFSICAMSVASAADKQWKQVEKYTLGGDGGWDYLRFDPAGNRLFIAHGDRYEVVDAASGKKTGEVRSDGAHGVALVQEKGRGFSANGRAGTVTVFDLKTLKPIQDIKVGEGPDAVSYDPHSKMVLVMNHRGKEISVIDPDAMKVVQTIPLGGTLEEAVTDAGHVYVNVEDTSEIAVVDSKTWKPTSRWKLEGCDGASALSIDEINERLFATCETKKMFVVNANTGAVVATVPTGSGTDGGGWDPGLHVAFASNGEGTLTIVKQDSPDKYSVLQNLTTERGARTMTVDPKTHRVYTVSADFGPPAEGQRRPSVKPDTFRLLVYAPE